jgi:aldehyde:ferredoxin oxidoreductase
MWNLSTGFNHTVESYLKCGERIWNLIRLFNLREGLKPGSDNLPSRLFNEPFKKGPAKDVVLTEEGFQKSLGEYYKLRGWDEKGVPTKEKLLELNLEKYI